MKCPYCAEDIQDAAVKCKHCGEWLNKPKVTAKDALNTAKSAAIGARDYFWGPMQLEYPRDDAPMSVRKEKILTKRDIIKQKTLQMRKRINMKSQHHEVLA
jgi:hypothetical protein